MGLSSFPGRGNKDTRNRDSALWDKSDSLALLQSEERGKGGRDEVLIVGKWEIIKSLSQKMTWLNKCM